jgi:similar to stage IV sporulation protein
VDVKGPNITAFINRATVEHFSLSQIQWIGDEHVRLVMSVEDYFRVKPLARETRSRVRIISKQGLPFFLLRLQRRKFFAIGILLFFLLIFALTSFVWSVDVEGNERVPTREILQLLKNQGVYAGQFKGRIPSDEKMQIYLQDKLPQLSWVGFRMEGTRVVVTVVEKKGVDDKEAEEDNGPVQFVAKKDALIYDMKILRGRPLVEVNDVIKKGQLLVSGRYGNPETPEKGKVVGVKGSVLGRVWYESDVVVPLTLKRKVYTGARDEVYYPYVASREIRIPFLYPIDFTRYETISHIRSLHLGKWRLPFGWVAEERMEMEWVKQKLSEKEALRLGKERARVELLSEAGQQARILGEKVLHHHVDNGKVYMKLHFDVVENIAVPQPILQGD